MSVRALLLPVIFVALLSACGGPEQPAPTTALTLTLRPDAVTVGPGERVQFEAALDPVATRPFTWRFQDGSLSATGRFAVYTAPLEAGSYEVSVAVPGEALEASATVTVAKPHPLSPDIVIRPAAGEATLATGTSIELTATLSEELTEHPGDELVWEASAGSIEAAGLTAVYTAPAEAGQYLVSASLPGVEDAFGSLVVDVPGGLLERFTIVVIPDTQTLVSDGDDAGLVAGMAGWIVENAGERDIAFVSHLGDVVWGEHWRASADVATQWSAALAGIDQLDDVAPYSVSIGDHDYDIEEDKASSTANYLEHLGPTRYSGYDWYGGSHPAGLSHYQIFEAGGRSFLHLNLEWEPMGPASDESTPLGWARSVLESHPHLPTFISTHAYLWDEPGEKGHFPDSAREGFFVERDEPRVTTSGAGIFETLVEPFPQVLMVFNGHYHKDREPGGSRGEYHQVSTNASGSEVFEMLSNYQWMSYADAPDWIRLVEFQPGAGDSHDRIDVSTFSPARRGTAGEFRDLPSSSFSFEIDFARRFAFD